MFSKVIAVLFCASAVAAQFPNGAYKISSALNRGSVCADSTGAIAVHLDGCMPSYDTWTLSATEGNGYALNNVGLSQSTSFSFAAVNPQRSGVVYSNNYPTVFNVESAGQGKVTFKLPTQDLLWYLEPNESIQIQPANGSPSQQWFLTAA